MMAVVGRDFETKALKTLNIKKRINKLDVIHTKILYSPEDTMHTHNTPMRVPQVKGSTAHQQGRGTECSHACQWEYNMAHTLWKQFGCLLNIKHIPLMWSKHSTPGYLPKRREHTCPHKQLSTNVQSFFFQTGHINSWMDKQSVTYPHNGILLSTKRS